MRTRDGAPVGADKEDMVRAEARITAEAVCLLEPSMLLRYVTVLGNGPSQKAFPERSAPAFSGSSLFHEARAACRDELPRLRRATLAHVERLLQLVAWPQSAAIRL